MTTLNDWNPRLQNDNETNAMHSAKKTEQILESWYDTRQKIRTKKRDTKGHRIRDLRCYFRTNLTIGPFVTAHTLKGVEEKRKKRRIEGRGGSSRWTGDDGGLLEDAGNWTRGEGTLTKSKLLK